MNLDGEHIDALGWGCPWALIELRSVRRTKPAPMTADQRRAARKAWDATYDAKNAERRRERQRLQKRRARAAARLESAPERKRAGRSEAS